MAITRYNPWSATPAIQDEIRQVFNRFFADDSTDQSNVVTSQWAPRVDIKEEDKRFVIFADIPGVDPKDIEVHMDKGILSLKGERQGDSADDGKDEHGRFTRLERTHGVFHRRFALPDSADADGITAHGKHGVLEIVIPKKPETTPRRIDIRSN